MFRELYLGMAEQVVQGTLLSSPIQAIKEPPQVNEYQCFSEVVENSLLDQQDFLCHLAKDLQQFAIP